MTVLNTSMERISFKIDVISEDDRDYVIENSSKLAPNVNLQIRFETARERKDAKRGGDTRTTTHDGGYSIHVNSFTPQFIREAEVEYVMIYRKDQVNGGSSDEVLKGSETVVIPSNSSATVQTDTVDLVNFYKAGTVSTTGGGCSKGNCSKGGTTATKSQRSRDFLIGCVARVIVDGHVVSVGASSSGILEKYKSEFSDSIKK